MLHNGKAFKLEKDNDLLILTFDLEGETVNKFNKTALNDLETVVPLLEKESAKGLIFKSGKKDYIVGADITEFIEKFNVPKEDLKTWITHVNNLFTRIEDLPYPTVAAINGVSLGGGMEFSLAMTYRLATPNAKLGLPETKLGIIPGWGGTVRMSRLCGLDHALEWICGGVQKSSTEALKIDLIDGIVEEANLFEASKRLIDRAASGEMDHNASEERKINPIILSKSEFMMSIETTKGFILGMTKGQYPAPMKAIDVMAKNAYLSRDEAIKVETEGFIEMAGTQVAKSLVMVFLGDQYLKKTGKDLTKNVSMPKKAAVLGAGIMGGGIAYQSAYKGTPIIMKDINQEAIDLGLNEATKILQKGVKRKKVRPEKVSEVLNAITPALSYGDFKEVDIIVEAIVENQNIKKAVLADLEDQISEDTVICSNTSTISITQLAEGLKRPENFCGMHFFNPVHRMPLVEVIRGKKTSEETIAKTVSYAMKMGKTPIVVNDCAGFLVNRVLFPYFGGFTRLVTDGVDFQRVDKVMSKFGWPMGPAYLLDVVGIDTAHHCIDIMGEAFPDRMKEENRTIINAMYDQKRFGQKNGKGFFEYSVDKKGRPKKDYNESVMSIIKEVSKSEVAVSDEEIIERMMLPMIFECSRCLEENIVQTAADVDMGLVLGLGFPPFRAGALAYADTLGLNNLIEIAKKYESLGNLYKPNDLIIKMAKEGKTFYQF